MDAHTSVFYSDLSAIQQSFHLHGINHTNLNFVECRHVLLAHLCTGTCLEFDKDIYLCVLISQFALHVLMAFKMLLPRLVPCLILI